MGLLLMQFEYQRAKVKANTLELRSIRLNDMQERYSKRIANVQTIFSKKRQSIENNFSQLSNQANMALQGGRGSVLAFNGAIGSFAAMGIKGITGQLSEDSILEKAKSEEDISDSKKQSLISQALTQAANNIQMQLQNAINMMKELELADLDMKEDAQLAPLADKDAELQSDIAATDAALEIVKSREEAAKNRLPDTIKKSVAHFGLS